jgi:hypothetical protein
VSATTDRYPDYPYPGQPLRVRLLLRGLADPEAVKGRFPEYVNRNGWYRLSLVPNIGAATLRQLRATGLVEWRRASYGTEYRLKLGVDDPTIDLGDLWVD